VHVVRCFEDENITHVRGAIDPVDDIRIINLELILGDMDSLERQIQKLEKKARSGDKEAKVRFELGSRVLAHLENEQPVRTLDLTDDERDLLHEFQLITGKPVVYAANVAEEDAASGNEKTRAVE